jgi:hypothetical protein
MLYFIRIVNFERWRKEEAILQAVEALVNSALVHRL